MLSSKEITKFQLLYKKRFNRDISYEEAMEKGIKLVHLMKIIYKPMSKTDYQKLEKNVKTNAS